MALNLRKAVVRNSVLTGSFCLVLSLGLSVFSGGLNMSAANLAWPVALALGIGVFTAWQVTKKIKKGVLANLPQAFSYTPLTRETLVNGIAVEWNAIDDYAIQLETRGYTRLGYFTTYPLPKLFVGVAACFVDHDASTLVEVQYIQISKAAAATARANPGGLHVSILSMLGGNITANTSDHTLAASNYLIRGEHSVVASFPGLGLLPLLEKHARLLAHLRERCGKVPLPGLTMDRYVLLQRERFAEARVRLEAMGGYQIATEIDAFEIAPRTNWSPPSATLAALPARTFADLDASQYADGTAPVMASEAIGSSTPVVGGTATHEEKLDAYAASMRQPTQLQQQIDSSASWFYWVAGLSLVNTVIAAAGSNWSFVIGLGIPQLLIAFAATGRDAKGSFSVATLALWAMSFAIPIFFAACGWFARRPSVAAFVAGTALFVLDSLIFVIGGDWIGVAFHALVLYFLWKGIGAARQLKKTAA